MDQSFREGFEKTAIVGLGLKGLQVLTRPVLGFGKWIAKKPLSRGLTTAFVGMEAAEVGRRTSQFRGSSANSMKNMNFMRSPSAGRMPNTFTHTY